MAVYLRQLKSYDLADIKNLLESARESLDISLQGVSSVFLKPNIVAGLPPDSGYITNPRFTGAVVEWFRDHGVSRIFVGEGPGVGLDERVVFEKSGYENLCRKSVGSPCLYPELGRG